ncbi:MAG: hypothetical protein V1841_00515 [Patescibacteria group bacterium]
MEEQDNESYSQPTKYLKFFLILISILCLISSTLTVKNSTGLTFAENLSTGKLYITKDACFSIWLISCLSLFSFILAIFNFRRTKILVVFLIIGLFLLLFSQNAPLVKVCIPD